MSMRTILVPVEPHDLILSVLETARVLAQRFDARIEGFAARSILTGFAVGDIAILTKPELDHAELVRHARRVFEDHMLSRGVPRDGSGPSFAWRGDAPPGDGFVGSYGRAFDVIVVGRPGTAGTSPRMSLVEAALFESGRPILVAPPEPPRSFGDAIAVAWNGSTETASTVALAMPLLRRAARVVVLGIQGWGEAPGAEQLARHLERNGIRVETDVTSAGGRNIGEAILARTAALGCDLLVKGAYTQSRLRQMVFGGATIHIMTRTTLPVFMAH